MSDVFLFVRKSCASSLSLLLWLKRAKCRNIKLRYVSTLRIIDVSTLSCGGVARRLRSVPSLVIKGHDQPVYGVQTIKNMFLNTRDSHPASTSHAASSMRTPSMRTSSGVAPSGVAPSGVSTNTVVGFAPPSFSGCQLGDDRKTDTQDITTSHTRQSRCDNNMNTLETALDRLVLLRKSSNTGIQRVG